MAVTVAVVVELYFIELLPNDNDILVSAFASCVHPVGLYVLVLSAKGILNTILLLAFNWDPTVVPLLAHVIAPVVAKFVPLLNPVGNVPVVEYDNVKPDVIFPPEPDTLFQVQGWLYVKFMVIYSHGVT